jgi:hypothetical protein
MHIALKRKTLTLDIPWGVNKISGILKLYAVVPVIECCVFRYLLHCHHQAARNCIRQAFIGCFVQPDDGIVEEAETCSTK